MALDPETARQTAVVTLTAAGLTVSESGDDLGVDLVVLVGGVPLGLQLKTGSTVTPEWVRHNADDASGPAAHGARLLIADRIVAAARDELRQRGWSWIDLRGHVHLSGPGVLVDTTVAVARQGRRRDNGALRGTVTLEVACELLLNPTQSVSVRSLARELNRSPSSVSSALHWLRDTQLITHEGTPVIPNLFWTAAQAWQPERIEVARFSLASDPAVATTLRTGWDDPGGIGWALTDAVAAASYGAPIGVRANHPPDFHVPDAATANRAVTLLGLAASGETRGATVRVAPVPQVCRQRNSPVGGSAWPLAHPLFVALDLAADPGRGTEVLSGWDPPGGVVRVW